MGMAVGGASKGAKAEINITPLIDVVLVLLIIFMVMTPMMLKELGVNVPKKLEQEVEVPQQANEQCVIDVHAGGEIQLNKQPVAMTALTDKVREALTGRRDKIVFFNVEDDAAYGDAVKAMDMARGGGAKVLGIMTKN
jgi:biopolymer transport protein TolR